MKYCTHCGKELIDEAVVCTGCGCATEKVPLVGTHAAVEDNPNGGLDLLGFFIPFVGLILFCVMHSTTPKKANQIGVFSLVGFILWFVLFMILMMI